MGASTAITFVCPVCDERFPVEAATRDALLSHGCVVCGAVVTEDSFRSEEGSLP